MQCNVISVGPNHATLTCYLQDPSTAMPNTEIRPAALIFPGGGYQYCSDREAEPVALAYLAEGYNAFVLRYTVGTSCPLDKALQDAQAALRHLRENAALYRIAPDKIVAIGFSAGGHLAAALGTQSEEKPNALVLGYAVTLGATWAPMGRLHEPDLGALVTDATPPAFLFATQGDSWCRLRIAWFLRKLCQNMISRSRCIFSRPGNTAFHWHGPAPAPVTPPV